MVESEYVIDGAYRCVKNYEFDYVTFTKGRWHGRSVIEVFGKEYRAFTKEYYIKAIEDGRITINGEKTTPDAILKNNQKIVHKTIRRELPVLNIPIKVVYEDKQILVINKPASIPVHVCGAYNKNTVIQIMAKEMGYKS